MTKVEQIAQKKVLLAEYLLCESKILLNQEYTIKDREYKRADLRTVVAERKRLEGEIISLERGGMRVRRFIPRDV